MAAKQIYAIGNSHLDPIWLWPRASGRSSMLNTVRSVVKLMEEFPDFKFSCSSADLYRWCEERDPGLFRRVVELVREGRWEPVGGWEVQSDAVITRLPILLKQAEIGQEYFRTRFGAASSIAYNVDTFGHTAMLPAILRQQDFTAYVYGRGQECLPSVFRWIADDGSEVVAHHARDGYGTPQAMSREQFWGRIRDHYKHGDEFQTFFYGIGDHGGGIYAKHLEWLNEARQEFPIRFATLAEFFADLKEQKVELPEFRGEIAPAARGIYSACRPVKEAAARTVRHLLKAERLGAPAETLARPWREAAFAHFHDIMPGSSIRKALAEDVTSLLGAADFAATEYMDEELAASESAADLNFITEGGFQVWSPHPFPVVAPVAMDAFSDPNAVGESFSSLIDRDGNCYPLQLLPGTTSYGPCLSPWGRLTAVLSLGASQEQFYAFSRRKAEPLENLGFAKQRELLARLRFPVLPDRNGVWGFTMTPYGVASEYAECTGIHEFADGPVCSILAATYRYRESSVHLELTAYRGISEVGVRLAVNWHERFTCLKLGIQLAAQPDFLLTGNAGGITERYRWSCDYALRNVNGAWMRTPADSPEYAFTDFCQLHSGSEAVTVYAPDLYSCNLSDGMLGVTLLRPSRYADFVSFPSFEREGWMDLGFSYFSLWIDSDPAVVPEMLPRRASVRLLTPEVREITGHAPSEFANPHARPPLPELSGELVAESFSQEGTTVWNPSGEPAHCRYANEEIVLKPHEIRMISSGNIGKPQGN